MPSKPKTSHLSPNSIGHNIRQARIAAGLTQQALGLALGYHGNPASQVCKLEKDHHQPSLAKLRKVAHALKVEVSALLVPRIVWRLHHTTNGINVTGRSGNGLHVFNVLGHKAADAVTMLINAANGQNGKEAK